MEWLALAGAAAALTGTWVLYRKQKKNQDVYMEYLAEKQSEFDQMLNDMEHIVEQFLVLGKPIQQDAVSSDTKFSDVYREAAAVSGGLERNARWMKAQEMLRHGVPAAEIVKRLQIGSGEIQLIDHFIKKSGQST
jgi:chromosome condensin MukBEF ATPase and DNA-binding subunit MukB